MSEAKIVYLPHCSKCGTLIRGNVSVRLERDYTVDRRDNTTTFIMPQFVFAPDRCGKCGAEFDGIVYPSHKDDRKEPFSVNTGAYIGCEGFNNADTT